MASSPITLIYETLGREAVEPVVCVVIVSIVSTPNDIRAGTASMLIQNDTQDNPTINALGM